MINISNNFLKQRKQVLKKYIKRTFYFREMHKDKIIPVSLFLLVYKESHFAKRLHSRETHSRECLQKQQITRKKFRSLSFRGSVSTSNVSV